MAGLLNASANGGKPLADPILQKIERQIEAKVPTKLKQQYMAIIVAGMAIMYSEKSKRFIVERMKASPDMAKNVANGVGDLVLMVFQNSGIKPDDTPRAQVFFDAAMLSCIALMCQVLDLGEKIGALKASPDLVAKCTESTYKETMRRFGVTEEMVRAEMAKSKGGQPQSAPVQPIQGV